MTALSGPRVEQREPAWDLMVILAGAPFRDESVSTALRYVDATASAGGRVLVWACGFSTWLTQSGLPETKPGNAMAWGEEHPSPQQSVRAILDRNAETLTWVACRFCSEEHGFVSHATGVRMKLASQMAAHSARARKTMTVGLI